MTADRTESLFCRLFGHKMRPIDIEYESTMAQAEVTYHDGSTRLVDTDVTWFATERCERCGAKDWCPS